MPKHSYKLFQKIEILNSNDESFNQITFSDLPNELIAEIIKYMDISSAINLQASSTTLARTQNLLDENKKLQLIDIVFKAIDTAKFSPGNWQVVALLVERFHFFQINTILDRFMRSYFNEEDLNILKYEDSPLKAEIALNCMSRFEEHRLKNKCAFNLEAFGGIFFLFWLMSTVCSLLCLVIARFDLFFYGNEEVYNISLPLSLVFSSLMVLFGGMRFCGAMSKNQILREIASNYENQDPDNNLDTILQMEESYDENSRLISQ